MGEFADAGIVAEYERLLALEQERRRKQDKLEALLRTIADALERRPSTFSIRPAAWGMTS